MNVFYASVIYLDVSKNSNLKLEFRFWRYITFVIFIDSKLNNLYKICVDIDCDTSLINRNFLVEKVLDY